MLNIPTEITSFNTTRIAKMSPYKVVIDGMILKQKVSNSQKIKNLYGTSQSPQKPISSILHETLDLENDVERILDNWATQKKLKNRSKTEKDEKDETINPIEYCQSGIMIPFERMAFVGGYLQRIGIQVSFVNNLEGKLLIEFHPLF